MGRITWGMAALVAAGCVAGDPIAADVGRCSVDDGPLPTLLSETGWQDADVLPYAPIAPLWSDGADKRRFVRLPCDARIDSSDVDAWRYPRGTTLWKEFSVGGKPVETRVMRKTGDGEGDWDAVAYAWRNDGSDAERFRDGVTLAGGWTVPGAAECAGCHANVADRVLGFTAIGLAHDGDGVVLDDLVAEDLLSDPPADTIAPVLGWDGPEAAALPALHASCGHCHGPGGIGELATRTDTAPGLSLRLSLTDATLADTALARTAIAVAAADPVAGWRVAPGNPEASALVQRMASREPGVQMPPIGRSDVDRDTVDVVTELVSSLCPQDWTTPSR